MTVERNMAVWYGELQSHFPRKLCINQKVIWVIFNGMFNNESCGGGHRCKYSYYIVTSCHIFHKNYKLVKNFTEGYFLHSVHYKTVWRPQVQILGLSTYFCLITTYRYSQYLLSCSPKHLYDFYTYP
jgi:hypothetical protein